MDSHEMGLKAGNAVLKKYGVSHYQKMNKLSQASRFAGMSKEDKSAYFKKVRSGQKITT